MGCHHSYLPDGSTTFRGQQYHTYRCEFCKNKLMTPATAAGARQVDAIHAKADRKDAGAAAGQEEGCLSVLVMVFVVLAAIVLIAAFG
jgi:hypothetical protein